MVGVYGYDKLHHFLSPRETTNFIDNYQKLIKMPESWLDVILVGDRQCRYSSPLEGDQESH